MLSGAYDGSANGLHSGVGSALKENCELVAREVAYHIRSSPTGAPYGHGVSVLMSGDMHGDAGIRLVRDLAVELFTQAQSHVPDVLGGRTDATPPHLSNFIRAQRSETGAPLPEHFQMPEPILGPIPSKVEVLVVGINPGYGPTEEIPTLSSSLQEYVAWYQTRMDRRNEGGSPISLYAGEPGIVRHYVTVERDYLTTVLGERALGSSAVYADAIPWKWNREWAPVLKDPQIGLEARARIGLVASILQPNLLLVLGGEPAKQLGTPLPSDEPRFTN